MRDKYWVDQNGPKDFPFVVMKQEDFPYGDISAVAAFVRSIDANKFARKENQKVK